MIEVEANEAAGGDCFYAHVPMMQAWIAMCLGLIVFLHECQYRDRG